MKKYLAIPQVLLNQEAYLLAQDPIDTVALAAVQAELANYGEHDMTPEEEAAILAAQAAEAAKQPEREAAALRAQANALLEKTDLVAIRCLKAGVPFPADWREYVAQLRQGVIPPAQPPYPEGT